MYRPAKPAPDARILKIRDYEDRLAKIKQLTAEDAKLGAAAAWEAKTDARIAQNIVSARFEALKSRREADIEARRHALAHKLHAEETALKEELVASQETPAQRKAKLADTARAMAARREAERAKLAAELMDRAFRENCDPLRQRYSKQIVYRTEEERRQQIEEKMSMTRLAEDQKRAEDAMYEANRLEKERRYQEDSRRQREQAGELKASLDAQMRHVADRQAAERAAEQSEVASMQAHWARLQAEQEDADARERARLVQLAAEVKRFNQLKRLEISETERRDREADLAILQEALAREAADEARDAEAREAKRQEVLHYREQLSAMMQKEAEETGQQDAMIDAVNRERQARQDAEWAAREEARRRLMSEVDAIRRQQIQYKADERAQALADKQQELRNLEAEEANAAHAAQHKAFEARRKALQQQLDLEAQMAARAHLKAAEAEDKLHAAELAVSSETRYMQRVLAAEAAVNPPQWFGRKKFNWMD